MHTKTFDKKLRSPVITGPSLFAWCFRCFRVAVSTVDHFPVVGINGTGVITGFVGWLKNGVFSFSCFSGASEVVEALGSMLLRGVVVCVVRT